MTTWWWVRRWKPWRLWRGQWRQRWWWWPLQSFCVYCRQECDAPMMMMIGLMMTMTMIGLMMTMTLTVVMMMIASAAILGLLPAGMWWGARSSIVESLTHCYDSSAHQSYLTSNKLCICYIQSYFLYSSEFSLRGLHEVILVGEFVHQRENKHIKNCDCCPIITIFFKSQSTWILPMGVQIQSKQ